jgi:hypothetical protein
VLLRGRLTGEGREGVASTAGGEDGIFPWKGGISGLKVAFFFPFSRWEDIVK